MEKGIREYPVEREIPPRVITHPRVVREKLVGDIDAYIRQGEYGKASDLLLTVVENASLPLNQIWHLLLAAVHQQDISGALGPFFDNIVSDLKNKPPYTAAMERTFYEIESGNFDNAYAGLMTLTQEQGSKLSFAYGYLGVLIACMREAELRRICKSADGVQPTQPHVFRLSESVRFCISEDNGQQFGKHTLRDAEKCLSQAIRLDSENEYFRGFYAQVLVAMDNMEKAKACAEQWYEKNKSIPSLLLLLAIGSDNIFEQKEHILEYLEMDPFAPADEILCPFMEATLDTLQDLSEELLKRILNMVADRIERGNVTEAFSWQYMAQLIDALYEEHEDIIGSVLEERLLWWKDTYFSKHVFCLADNSSDALVYRAVCAQQLIDLPVGHPVYALLSGDLTNDQAAFVDSHIKVTQPSSLP
ncbi:hypothetical protein GGI26_005104 [Coemansia sp. RSA 1358]|nr:hypothetical protein GGI26_005104 [Coemansia sp. RSA 1358]